MAGGKKDMCYHACKAYNKSKQNSPPKSIDMIGGE